MSGSTSFIVSCRLFCGSFQLLIEVSAKVSSDVCKDFVLYDIAKENPFRELIPLCHYHPILLQIIVANSALHMSNARQKTLATEMKIKPDCHQAGLSGSTHSSLYTFQPTRSYNDALLAKQRALVFLKCALADISVTEFDVTVATVLLFVEFELIDSGRDEWRHHIIGARTIIEVLCESAQITQTFMSPLRSCLISNCLVYVDIPSANANRMPF